MKNKCNYCHRNLHEIPHGCRYCGKIHCSKHILPENHKCKGLEKFSKREKRKYQEGMAELAASHAIVTHKGGYKEIVNVEPVSSSENIDEDYYHNAPKTRHVRKEKISNYDSAIKQSLKLSTKKEKISSKRNKKYLPFLIIGGLLLVFAIILYGTMSQIVDVNVKNITNEISFDSYLKDLSYSHNQNVTLNGIMKREVKWSNPEKTVGTHVISIVDDENNEIILRGKYNEIDRILPQVGQTSNLFSVQGVLKWVNNGLDMEVEKITLYQREEIKQTITKTSHPQYPLFRNFVFNLIGRETSCEDGTKIDSCSNNKPLYCGVLGLAENPSKCGCPLGMRIYEDKCIWEVKCSDGTLSPECSLALKMQCDAGKFVYNPAKCGCPEKYLPRQNTCVKTCNDGTAYGECSRNKPSFCSNGILVNDASTCGCPGDYKASGNECVSKIEYMERLVHTLINQERARYGLLPLSFDDRIALIAREHSQDMATRSFFEHVNPDGEDPTDRANRNGYSCRKNYGSYYTVDWEISSGVSQL